MQKTLIAFSVATLLSLTACSDGWLLKDDNNRQKAESASFNLESAYTGPGKDYNPKVDHTKEFMLYKVSYNQTGQQCVLEMQFIEDQMDRNDCLAKRRVNIEKDELLSEGDSEEYTPRLIQEGPNKGKENWAYWCFKEKGVEAWNNNKCETLSAND